MPPHLGILTLLRTCQSLNLQQKLRFLPLQLTSTHFPKRSQSTHVDKKVERIPDNKTLLENLNYTGVEVMGVRTCLPELLRQSETNKSTVLAQFLQEKGATPKQVASIVSRYPRAVTRSAELLEERWLLWRDIFETDEEIVEILYRSPESFFRSNDNENLKKNIGFFMSLGLQYKVINRILKFAPRTCSNKVELNKQMAAFLGDVCKNLNGRNPEKFVTTVVSRNIFIFTRSTKRVEANIEVLKKSLDLQNYELLKLLQGQGAQILGLSNQCLMRNYSSLEKNMISFGCHNEDVKHLIISNPGVLFSSTETLLSKILYLLKEGITMEQMLKKHAIFKYSKKSIEERLLATRKVGYDCCKNGITILCYGKKLFWKKIEKLSQSLEK